MLQGHSVEVLSNLYIAKFTSLAEGVIDRICGQCEQDTGCDYSGARAALKRYTEERARDDVRFLAAGCAAPGVAEAPQTPHAASSAGPGDSRPSTLLRTPGFGKSPKRTRRKR